MTVRNVGHRVLRRGVGLIEIAMGLGIAALIIAAALAYFGSANVSRQVNDALGQVSAIQQTVRSLSSGQAGYTGITDVVVAQSRQLPVRYLAGGTTPTGLRSAFSSQVTITPATVTTADDAFDVVMLGVSRDACSRLATSDLGTGMISVDVAGSGSPGVARSGQGAYTPATANAACAAPTNSIGWRFN